MGNADFRRLAMLGLSPREAFIHCVPYQVLLELPRFRGQWRAFGRAMPGTLPGGMAQPGSGDLDPQDLTDIGDDEIGDPLSQRRYVSPRDARSAAPAAAPPPSGSEKRTKTPCPRG